MKKHFLIRRKCNQLEPIILINRVGVCIKNGETLIKSRFPILLTNAEDGT